MKTRTNRKRCVVEGLVELREILEGFESNRAVELVCLVQEITKVAGHLK